MERQYGRPFFSWMYQTPGRSEQDPVTIVRELWLMSRSVALEANKVAATAAVQKKATEEEKAAHAAIGNDDDDSDNDDIDVDIEIDGPASVRRRNNQGRQGGRDRASYGASVVETLLSEASAEGEAGRTAAVEEEDARVEDQFETRAKEEKPSLQQDISGTEKPDAGGARTGKNAQTKGKVGADFDGVETGTGGGVRANAGRITREGEGGGVEEEGWVRGGTGGSLSEIEPFSAVLYVLEGPTKKRGWCVAVSRKFVQTKPRELEQLIGRRKLKSVRCRNG